MMRREQIGMTRIRRKTSIQAINTARYWGVSAPQALAAIAEGLEDLRQGVDDGSIQWPDPAHAIAREIPPRSTEVEVFAAAIQVKHADMSRHWSLVALRSAIRARGVHGADRWLDSLLRPLVG